MPTADILKQLEGLSAASLEAAVKAETERRSKQPQSPAALGRIVMGKKWKDPKHLQLLDEKLVMLAKGEIKRLAVTMPPRHGKSLTCSQMFPAWFLGTNPDKKVIVCSYAATLAANFSGKVRDMLAEHGPKIFGIGVDEQNKARDDWRIARREGGLRAAGVGGAITGLGSHLLLVDDPFSNQDEASSQTMRDKVFDWWQTTALTRLEPDGSVLIVHTRWNEDDLIGRLLQQTADGMDKEEKDEPWHLVNFPAIAEEDDALGRKPGEALWPERFPIDVLKKRRAGTAPFHWSAIYQQRPSPDAGEVFNRDWFRYFRREGDIYNLYKGDNTTISYSVAVGKCIRIATMDVATSEEQTSDFTCLGVWDITPSYDMLLVDMWRDRKQSPTVIDTATAMARRYNCTALGIEVDGVGLGVLQNIRAKGVTVKPLKSKGLSKRMRAMVAAQARMAAGMIFFPRSATYLDILETELLNFPNGKKDDTVDMLSWAAIWVQQLGGAPRNSSDDAYDKEQDSKTTAETPNRVGDMIKELVPAGAPQDGLSEDARAWLAGGWAKWMKPSRN